MARNQYETARSKLYPDFKVGELKSAQRRRVLLIGGPDYRKTCKFTRGLRCGVEPWQCPMCRETEVAFFKATHPEAL